MESQPKRLRVGIMLGAAAVGAALGGAAIAGAATGGTSSATGTTEAATANAPDPSQAQHPGETLLTGTTAEKVKAAALAAVPGGTILRVETDAEGSPYEAHMTKADGTEVTVKVDAGFNVTTTEAGHGGGGPGGPGGHGPGDRHGPPPANGSAPSGGTGG